MPFPDLSAVSTISYRNSKYVCWSIVVQSVIAVVLEVAVVRAVQASIQLKAVVIKMSL